MVPIDELLKNKVVKISFAEVAEYLLQVVAEKNAQNHLHISPSLEVTVSSSNDDDVKQTASE